MLLLLFASNARNTTTNTTPTRGNHSTRRPKNPKHPCAIYVKRSSQDINTHTQTRIIGIAFPKNPTRFSGATTPGLGIGIA